MKRTHHPLPEGLQPTHGGQGSPGSGGLRQKVPEFLQTRVNAVGGCCGTTPEHIRLLTEEVREESTKG